MRIIRFIDERGAAIVGEGDGEIGGSAMVLEGSIGQGFTRTNRRATIGKLLAPLVPSDIICIGRNYPASPTAGSPLKDDATLEVFLKPSTSLQNPDDPILIPRFEGVADIQLDCEGELAVVIGREARNISERDALHCVFGYTLANDITARHFQTPTGPPLWMRGKGFDSFCPIGPAIVTTDEIPDPQNLHLRTLINGEVARDGNTRDMIRSVPQIIAALSRHMTLRVGAVILTGAPAAGTRSLRRGDLAEVSVDSIGRLRNHVM